MTLDPDVAQLLETVRLAGRPPFESLSPAEAREAYAKTRTASAPPPADVERVETLHIDGPHGPIPMRFYWPKDGGTASLPLLVYFHGGGWLLGDLSPTTAFAVILRTAPPVPYSQWTTALHPSTNFPLL